MLSGQIIPHLADFPNVPNKNPVFDDKFTSLRAFAAFGKLVIARVDKKPGF
jgi:hypothetical protein